MSTRCATTRRFAAALWPVLVTLGLWLAGRVTFEVACNGSVKELSCGANPQSVLVLAGLGVFWMPIIVWVTAPVSAFRLARALSLRSLT